MGVYGDFLGVFSELFEYYEIAECTPEIGGKFTITSKGTIRGYIQDGESGLNVKDNYSRGSMSGGSASGIVSALNICYLYTNEPVALYDNCLIYKGVPYRAMVDSNYNKEGDFYVTELHRLIGSTSLNEKITDIVKGAFD